MRRAFRTLLAGLIAALAVLPLHGYAQNTAQPAAFSKEQIEQLVAPIALYPDALVAQILMASTYPLEIVSAARWSKANPSVKGKALEDAMQKQTWEASVKSLAAFPQVLAMMNEKLDWTQKLGDAFLAQQKEVMAAVQQLRAKALAAGNLKTSKEQKITTTQEGSTTIIVIEPANPQVVYVPTYNPTVVYGPWPYPAYPPYYYYPPGYVAGATVFAFAVGVAVGNAMWGNTNWNSGTVNVNVNQYNSYNKTNISNTSWQHSAENRKGVAYSNNAVAQQYGKGASSAQVQARQAYRGHTGSALTPQEQQQAQARAQQGQQQQQTQARAQQGQQQQQAQQRAQQGQPSQQAAQTSAGGGRQAGAFEGMGGGGGEARAQSSRGSASRASAAGGGGRGGGGGRR